jgi:hypothetical protein
MATGAIHFNSPFLSDQLALDQNGKRKYPLSQFSLKMSTIKAVLSMKNIDDALRSICPIHSKYSPPGDFLRRPQAVLPGTSNKETIQCGFLIGPQLTEVEFE